MAKLFEDIRAVFFGISNRIRKPQRPVNLNNSINIFYNTCFLILKTMVILILIFFVVYYAFTLTQWIFDKSEGIIVQPFEMNEVGAKLSGTSTANLFLCELQRIKEINERDYANSEIPNVHVTKKRAQNYADFYIPTISNRIEPIEYSISEIGTVGMDKTSLSLGNILLSMKELSSDRVSTITGSLQRYGSTVSMVAILEDRRSGQKRIAAWEVRRNLSDNNQTVDEQIPAMVKDLAFQIAHGMSKRWGKPGVYPQNWLTFKYITQGKEAFTDYIATRNTSSLNKARNLALYAKCSEPLHPGSFELLSDLGFAYMGIKNYTESEYIFRNISNLEPFRGNFNLGLVYAKEENYTESLKAFDKATKLNSSSAEAWYNKGIALGKLGNNKDAAEAFDRSIKQNSSFEGAWYNKGTALFLQDKYPEAIAAYDQAIELNSSCSEAWCGKGTALLESSNPDNYRKAAMAFDAAIELDPFSAEAWNNKGEALRLQGKKDDALNAYNKSLDLDPSFAKAWYNKGSVLMNHGYYPESIEAFDNATVFDPRYKEAWIAKGVALGMLGNHAEAAMAFDRVINISPSSKDAWNFKGDALRYQGKCKEALDAYNKSLEIDSSFAEARHNRDLVLNGSC
jgi:tetratricopeptide (TPR) repeat protein